MQQDKPEFPSDYASKTPEERLAILKKVVKPEVLATCTEEELKRMDRQLCVLDNVDGMLSDLSPEEAERFERAVWGDRYPRVKLRPVKRIEVKGKPVSKIISENRE